MATTHYVTPYVGTELHTVIMNADEGDTVMLMPGVHILKIPHVEYGITLDKTIFIEGRINSIGVLPVVEVYNPQAPKSVFYVNNSNVAVYFRRIIFRYWGQRAVVNPDTLRYFMHANQAASVQFSQVAIIGPSFIKYSNNKPSGIYAGWIGTSGVLIRNCTFANLNVAINVYTNAGQYLINDCIFQKIHDYVLDVNAHKVATMNYCNFDSCPSPRHTCSPGASVLENNCTTKDTRMWASKSISEGLYNVNSVEWEEGGDYTFLSIGTNRVVFGYYTDGFKPVECPAGDHRAGFQGPTIYQVKKSDISIDASKYKHVYVGVVTAFRDTERGGQRPALRWKRGGNWYYDEWDWNDGYIFDSDIADLGHNGVLHHVPLITLHKDLTNINDWQGTITQLTYMPFAEVVRCMSTRWTAVGWIIVSQYHLTAEDLYEKLIQTGVGYLLPTDSELINTGSPGVYDDWMSPHLEAYIGKLGPTHDVGAYGGIVQTPYIAGRPYFEDLYPEDDYTITSLPYVSIHLKQSSLTYTQIDWSSIQVEAFGSVYSQANPSDSNAVLTLTGTVVDVLITLTLIDDIPDDPFTITFRGSDANPEEAPPYTATYYLWEGKGTIEYPFKITPATGIMAYEDPKPVLKRWAHCYDQVQVKWDFGGDTSEIIRGLSKGARKLLSLTDNSLIQTSNLGGHSADLLLEKFGKERKELEQTLPFAPFIDPYDILQLFYPSKHYLIDRNRKWVVSELKLSPKTGKIQFKGLESYES